MISLRRTAAFLADFAIIGIYMVGLAALGQGAGVAGLGVDALLGDPLRAHLIGVFLLTLPVVMYHAVWEGSAAGGTPGKLLMGLRVRRVPEERGLPLERATLRAAVKFLPWELAHTALRWAPGWPGESGAPAVVASGVLAFASLAVAGYLAAALVTAGGRTPYDRLAGAVVVRARRPLWRARASGARKGVPGPLEGSGSADMGQPAGGTG